MSDYIVHIRPEPQIKVPKCDLAAAAQAALQFTEAEPGELTIVLTDEEHIRHLNRQFAGHDRPTDVLAFGSEEIDPEEQLRYYGDVIIAVPIARTQAENAGHSLATELRLLTIHGVLHLLHYHHHREPDRKRMWSAQTAILDDLGGNIIGPGKIK